MTLWRLTGQPSLAVCLSAVEDHLIGLAVDFLPTSAAPCWEETKIRLAGGPPTARMVLDHRSCATCEVFRTAEALLREQVDQDLERLVPDEPGDG